MYPCCFCDSFDGLPSEDDHDPGPLRLSDRVIVESQRTVALAGLGSLRPGYVVVCLRKHYVSMARVEQDDLDDFMKIKESVGREIQRAFGQYFCFEHGDVMGGGTSGACHEHAHLHLIPCPESPRPMLRSTFEEVEIGAIKELKQFASRQQPYFWLEDFDGRNFAYTWEARPPRQFIRRWWHQIVGGPSWNWLIAPEIHHVKRTLDTLRPTVV